MTTPNESPTPNPQLSFADTVKVQLEAKGFKPKCFCNAIGWANFEIVNHPVYAPLLMSNQGVPAACLICQKCGEMRFRNLKVIGVNLTVDERRVLTASELAQQQQKPQLIVPG